MTRFTKALCVIGLFVMCALGYAPGAQANGPWVRGCGNAGLNSPYLRWQVLRIHVGMSAATAAAISPHLGGQEFDPNKAGVPPRQVPCLVADETASTFRSAYVHWRYDDHWLNVTPTAYGGSWYLGRFWCSTPRAGSTITETCHHSPSSQAGAISVRMLVHYNPYQQ